MVGVSGRPRCLRPWLLQKSDRQPSSTAARFGWHIREMHLVPVVLQGVGAFDAFDAN